MSERTDTCDLLLTGGSVVTVDDERRVLEPGAVAISGERIDAVGTPEELANYEAGRTIDCTDKAVIPGLIDAHTHTFQGLGRGLGDGMSLYPWLTDFMWPFARVVSTEEAWAGVRLTALEAARAGTTAVLDDHYAPVDVDTTVGVARAIEEVGLRGVVARGIYGPPADVTRHYDIPDYLFAMTSEEELEITGASIEATIGRQVQVWPAPDGQFIDRDLISDSVALAHELDVRWHIHCSAPKSDPEAYESCFGERPVVWMHREGLLDERAVLAHGVWLDDEEVAHAGEAGVGIPHCPTSNCYMADGAIRLRDLRSAGVVVGLGSDGSACDHRQDMFEQMKQSIFVQRLHTLNPTESNAEEAFELATREGARILGIDAGVLAPGKLADIAVVDLDQVHLQPLNRTIATLVYAARGSDVVMTIVGGQIIYENGASTRVDERRRA
ncbi:MAG: amidohydrolase [Acidimicrobiaceae bacterium]|nr:amidohydrolase [Acidimicrobiaceae bacterium]